MPGKGTTPSVKGIESTNVRNEFVLPLKPLETNVLTTLFASRSTFAPVTNDKLLAVIGAVCVRLPMDNSHTVPLPTSIG